MVVFHALINAKYLDEIYGDDLSIIQIMFESFLEDSIPIWEKILEVINSQNFLQVSEPRNLRTPSESAFSQ